MSKEGEVVGGAALTIVPQIENMPKRKSEYMARMTILQKGDASQEYVILKEGEVLGYSNQSLDG